jgi:hypothetical protein
MSPSETKFGTFESLVAGLEPHVEGIARLLRGLILDLHPDAVEVVRLGDNTASYGVGPKKMSEAYSYIMPQKGYVNLGFYHGASLVDPEGLLEGTGKRLRHVKLRSVEETAQTALRQLIEKALADRREAPGRP